MVRIWDQHKKVTSQKSGCLLLEINSNLTTLNWTRIKMCWPYAGDLQNLYSFNLYWRWLKQKQFVKTISRQKIILLFMAPIFRKSVIYVATYLRITSYDWKLYLSNCDKVHGDLYASFDSWSTSTKAWIIVFNYCIP